MIRKVATVSLQVSLCVLILSCLVGATERHALVIGNGQYRYSPLSNPVSDAQDLATVLHELDFGVLYLENASQRKMEDAIRLFGKRLKRGGTGLFYFAGHGLQVGGRNYLVPIGADIRVETDTKYEAVDAARVLDAMYNAGNELNVVILDACRNNPYARSFRSSGIGLARMDAPKGTLIAYATSPGSVAFDGSGRNSPYTGSLLKHISTPDLRIEQVFKRVRRDVIEITDGRQIPWESTSLTGDFIFNPKTARIAGVEFGPGDRDIIIRKSLPMGRFITFGTGGITGVYYPVGGAIARIVNRKKKEYGIQCAVESTGGSVFNIRGIMAGELEFGIAQSDRQYQAFKGLGEWNRTGPQRLLRSVFSVHSESLTLVAAADAGIGSVHGLKGKRVNIGNPGSGQRQMSADGLAFVGLDYRRDIKATNLRARDAPDLLQRGKIDAFFYTVGHPSGTILEATRGKRKVRILPITGVESQLHKCPYYAKSTIPMKFYPNAVNSEDVPTFGMKATFVTSVLIPDDVVYAITKEVFDHLEDFKKLHPAFGTLTRREMLEALSAPLHPGALRYYKEVGLK